MEGVFIPRQDQANDAEVWEFVRMAGFGQLIAAGRGRDLPVVVPTQYVVARSGPPPDEDDHDGVPHGGQAAGLPDEGPGPGDDQTPDRRDGGGRDGGRPADDGLVLVHLARPNPIWAALAENPRCLLSVAGDWAYIPGGWKALGDEDPAYGIPTTYYAAAQLTCRARIIDEPAELLEILRAQLARFDTPATTGPGGLADPSVHTARLGGIRGLRLTVEGIRGKMKFGGNVDVEHRLGVARRLADRAGPGDAAARGHLLRRLPAAIPGQPSAHAVRPVSPTS